jgi:hypothetical protein
VDSQLIPVRLDPLRHIAIPWQAPVSRRAWLWLCAFCALAPFVYAYIQAYWAFLLVPTLQTLGVHSRPGTIAVITLFDIVGALMAAVALAFPLALLARQPSPALGLGLGLITITILLVTLPLFEGGGDLWWTRIVEYAAFVVFCTVIAHLIGRMFHDKRA